MPSFFLGLLFNLFRMKIIARTVLRTFSLGKSPINPHVKIFPRCLSVEKKPFFCLRKTVFSYLPLRGKFLPHRSFCFSMRFSQAYRPYVQVRKRRNRGEVCRFDNGKGFCPMLSARKPRFHWLPFLSNDMEVQSKHLYRGRWQYPYVRQTLFHCLWLLCVAMCGLVSIALSLLLSMSLRPFLQVLFRTVILFQHCLYKPA